jgi:hypothetical protein
VLALSSALLTLSARSSTGVTTSALATACLIVVLTAVVMWSLLGKVVSDVPPAAPFLELTTPGGRGVPGERPNARSASDAQPESTASVPLKPAPERLPDRPAMPSVEPAR